MVQSITNSRPDRARQVFRIAPAAVEHMIRFVRRAEIAHKPVVLLSARGEPSGFRVLRVRRGACMNSTVKISRRKL